MTNVHREKVRHNQVKMWETDSSECSPDTLITIFLKRFLTFFYDLDLGLHLDFCLDLDPQKRMQTQNTAH